LANASKTVFISGKPVALKNKSYFKTSTGNEAATRAFPMGVISHTIKGKAYFTSWSMDVKVEGFNVCRHMDMMTHNHASVPGNTGAWMYVDHRFLSKPCKKEIKRVEKACGGQEKSKKKNIFGKTKWKDAGKKIHWKKKHCKGLLIKPKMPKNTSANDFIKQLKSDLNELDSQLSDMANVDKAISEAVQEAKDVLKSKGVKFVVKQGIKKVPYIGWLWQVLTIKGDIADAAYLLTQANALLEEAKRISQELSNLKSDITDLLSDIKTGKTKDAAKKIANWQHSAAIMNSCTRARKCMLTAMSNTYDGNKGNNPDDNSYGVKKSGRSSGGKDTRRGCCPGQTGHHMIPDAFFKNRLNKSQCPKYEYDDAPVVCVEGVTYHQGSHGALHTNFDVLASKAATDNKEISYKNARDAAIEAHAKTFPFSICSRDCLKAQMDKYYDKKAKCDDDSSLKYKKIAANQQSNTSGNSFP
jgi:hypothetical protein